MLLERDRRCRGTPTIVSTVAGAAAGFALAGALVIGLGISSLSAGERAATALVDGTTAFVLVMGARRRWRQQPRYEWLLMASVGAMLCVAVVGYSQARAGSGGAAQGRVQALVCQAMAGSMAVVGAVALLCDGSRAHAVAAAAVNRV